MIQPDVTRPGLLMGFYGAGNVAEALLMTNAVGEEDLDRKRRAITRHDRDPNVSPGDVGLG